MRHKVGACGAPYQKPIFRHSAVLLHDVRWYEARIKAGGWCITLLWPISWKKCRNPSHPCGKFRISRVWQQKILVPASDDGGRRVSVAWWYSFFFGQSCKRDSGRISRAQANFQAPQARPHIGTFWSAAGARKRDSGRLQRSNDENYGYFRGIVQKNPPEGRKKLG